MPEFEKLTINLGPVDLGQIELLVDQGFYANRAEFIRIAIQNQLQRHGEVVKEAAARESFVLGAMFVDRAALERARGKGVRLNLRVVGLLSLGEDVEVELAREMIKSIHVRGILRAPPALKAALADRIR
jgi:Arc/MetJ-type ribon-helix-helix transcriptional regulator